MASTEGELGEAYPQTTSHLERSARKTRKPHKKSRQGCHTCKRRKVKCDESKPECEKCKKFGVPCDFLPREEREIRGLTANSASQPPSERRRPGRPRGDWVRQLIDPPRDASQPPGTFIRSSQHQVDSLQPRSQLSLPTTLDIDELLTFHHYLTVTAPTIGQPYVWRDGAPQLGKVYPGILDAMLSISAYHLARTNILHAPKHLSVAERHYAAAAKAATAMVADVTIENSQAVYVIAALICFTAFAKGPKPGDLVLIAKDGSVAWLYLLRGVRMVLEKFGTSVVLSGILEPNATRQDARPSGCSCPSTDLQPRDQRFELSHPGWDWHETLDKLRRQAAAESHEPHDAAMFQRQTASIARCFQALTQPREGSSDENRGLDFISVMTWVWALDDSFINALKERHQVALIILGCFGVLLKSLQGYWWLDGWGDHVLKELRTLLGSVYQEWLP
ncbi:hypothetical protein QBC40DRAFT_198594 [Triangularia verruculosa]|uniref:Zn(2)-C6 fungal-type domain-containing protein n=1 Tax=Triangularia verruculosa TaxID=2587418 RepID=A0AAN6XIS6_9PEZI|nr:hypothetical protein QBC40DRAFT_198594 [Triangularia verruculosa]